MRRTKTQDGSGWLKALVAAAILAGSAGLAEAALHPRPVRVRPVRVVRRHPVVRVLRPRPAVTVVHVAPAPKAPTAEELKAEIARLKVQYGGLCLARDRVKAWLDGPGKDRGETDRAPAQARLAKAEVECAAVAARIADLEKKLAEF